jgi:hypothetical protein
MPYADALSRGLSPTTLCPRGGSAHDDGGPTLVDVDPRPRGILS